MESSPCCCCIRGNSGKLVAGGCVADLERLAANARSERLPGRSETPSGASTREDESAR